ncbi:hypothetical protein BJ875DRAFT_487074 [Amylocarpus encephaloides]|uniref:Uncharacterized protein n=1 Tax=Amylocarpus encephaloides TaxID=45428 RepID=A0A9P8C3V5_9HELO|nr:hypothetical protein BJ875DRAFT_487074 [Amylocarpus encephaloides]
MANAKMPHDINALLAHIQTLEEKIKYFEEHHQCCSLVDDSNSNNDEPISSGITIIPYKHRHVKVPKEPDSNPKWRKDANQLLENVPHLTEWTTKITELKLSENASTIVEICGVPAQILAPRGQTTNSQVDGVMAMAQAYARATKASHDNTTYVLKLHTFRVLVFVSFCAVLEALDYPINEINETMRICVSNSSDVNLKRLRSGAVWANRRIVELDSYLGGNATEWFFDCAYTGITATKCRRTRAQRLDGFDPRIV